MKVDDDYYQVAIVARDDRGECLWWRVRKLAGQPVAVVGEASAALEGVLLVMEKGWTDWDVKGDCAQVMTAIQQVHDDVYLPFGSLLVAILRHVRLMPNFSCSFIRLLGNRLAHALAHIHVGTLDVLQDSMIPTDLVY